MNRLARRMDAIAPFEVMAILDKARRLEAAGRRIVHLEIGEPDFPSPENIIDAGKKALKDRLTHYTPAAGLPELRTAIATYYRDRLGVEIDPGRILVTPGASGALQLVLGVLVNPGDRVGVTDPGYPCNRNMILQYGGNPVPIPVSMEQGYGVSLERLGEAMREALRALIVASPANPTGNLISLEDLRALHDRLSHDPASMLVCDEIYQGLQYGVPVSTALALNSDRVIVVNSFSKYFGMTGWRVGWVVAPAWMVEPLERLAQNIFLAAPTVSQYAALSAFHEATLEVLEVRRRHFEQRRDYLHAALTALGFQLGPVPEGAFYLYAGLGDMAEDSRDFSNHLLQHAGVAATPGYDFGRNAAAQHVRFAYTTGLENLEEGVERIRRFVGAGG
jgi:aspartate/methionine/tyrosine aminotransferase